MTTVGSYEAKTHLPALLRRVQNGESITITRGGVPIALLSPTRAHSMMSFDEAFQRMKALRKKRKGKELTIRQIKQMIHEGHRY